MKYKKYILLILVVAIAFLSSCTKSNHDKSFNDCFDSVYPELEMALEEKGQLRRDLSRVFSAKSATFL